MLLPAASSSGVPGGVRCTADCGQAQAEELCRRAGQRRDVIRNSALRHGSITLVRFIHHGLHEVGLRQAACRHRRGPADLVASVVTSVVAWVVACLPDMELFVHRLLLLTEDERSPCIA
jgi:hypothetical protein